MYATYDPEDNKLRYYPDGRLNAEDYARIKAAGFRWAPAQKLFVAPAWSPSRADLLEEWCGEIIDEDTTLVDRAEERAERFEDYSAARQDDADRAHAAVHAIADNIPLGQPILVGHHSERHARKDAEKIQNNMRRAVKMWETAKYWEQRAAGALAHAKYKERPDVRARRIKGLEADLRRCIAEYTPRDKYIIMQQKGWSPAPDAPKVPHAFCGAGSRGGRWVAVEDLETIKANNARWEQHYQNRIAYERAMLGESGGLVAEQQEIVIGGRVLVRGEWCTVLRVNRKDGKVCSFRTNRRYVSQISAEEVQGYEPPTEEHAAAVAAAMKRPATCNYPGERFATCTQAEWKAINKDYKSTVHVIEATDTLARHCVRYAIGFKVHIPAPTGKELEPSYCNANRTHTYWPVFITDAKRVDPPTREQQDTKPRAQVIPPPSPDLEALKERAERLQQRQEAPPEDDSTKFEQLRETLKAGIKVVSAPQLFPTPPDLARQMVEEADIQPGMCVLEPSAGTGNIVRAVIDSVDTEIVGYEINFDLCLVLRQTFPSYKLQPIQADILEVAPSNSVNTRPTGETAGLYPRILMNPPFANGQDIAHIKHAMKFLAPGGRLVAICANGPRQQEQLKPLVDSWEDLPRDTFKESGTGVNTALLIYDAPEAVQEIEATEPARTTTDAPQQTTLFG
jgi:phospholipid N-methyltransferase